MIGGGRGAPQIIQRRRRPVLRSSLHVHAGACRAGWRQYPLVVEAGPLELVEQRDSEVLVGDRGSPRASVTG